MKLAYLALQLGVFDHIFLLTSFQKNTVNIFLNIGARIPKSHI